MFSHRHSAVPGCRVPGEHRHGAPGALPLPPPHAADPRRHVPGSRSKARKTALVFRPDPRGRARLPREWPGDALPAASSSAQPPGAPQPDPGELSRTPACSACSAGRRSPSVSPARTPPPAAGGADAEPIPPPTCTPGRRARRRAAAKEAADGGGSGRALPLLVPERPRPARLSGGGACCRWAGRHLAAASRPALSLTAPLLRARGRRVCGAVVEVRRSSGNVFVLLPNLNLPWHNVRPFPLILSLVTREKRPTPPPHNLLSLSCREQ